MSETNSNPSDARATPPGDVYTHDYDSLVTGYMVSRTAQDHAGFLLSHLRAGMTVLDCGSGTGSITLGIANTIAPGEAVGVDVEPGQVEFATNLAAERGITNVRFEVASSYELPFPGASFDAVFSSAMLEHLSEPLKALEEMRRVLQSDGVIGVRDCDLGAYLMAPVDPTLEELISLWEKLWRHNGGDPRAGRELPRLLREAGFADISISASYEQVETLRTFGDVAEFWAAYYGSPNFVDQVVQLGWYDRTTLQRMAKAWSQWGENPDAFYLVPYCEAVGFTK